ncbi:substrate-binding domain-containing protein, partial [bacterium]|nr:substrate-binding domain-containing protein [bacterium]
MNFNFIHSIPRQRIIVFGFVALAVSIIVAIGSCILLERSLSAMKPIVSNSMFVFSKILILTALLCGLFILAGLIWLIQRRTLKPMNSLMKTGQSLTTVDCPSLTAAMTELTQGNLTVDLSIRSKQLSPSEDPELNRFVDVFNNVISSLQETAEEFNKLTNTPSLRLCYVGADSFLEGRRCGEVMGEALRGKGEVAVSTSSLSATGPELRRKGFESIIREKYPEIRIVHVSEDQELADLAYKQTSELLKQSPHITGFYITTGATPCGVAKAVVEAKKEKHITIVGHDLTDETMNYVKDGIISATLGQDPFAQGYNPVIYLFNHLVDGWQPSAHRLLTKMDVVTPKNFRQFWEEGKGLIQSQEALDHLAKPVDKEPSKQLRIAAIGRETSAFWVPVREGALAAGEKLKPYNVEVEWIYPENARKNNDHSAAVYGRVIESLISQGCDAIATLVVDRHLIPYINEAVKAGIPVVTFNSEPSSLRSLVFTISDQAQKLMGLSQNLAASTVQVNQATTQISKAMGAMAAGAVSQNDQVGRTSKSLEDLLNNINSVSREADESASAAESTVGAVGAGTDAMEKTLSSMKAIEKSVGDTWHIVEDLGKHSERIDVIVELIDDIASRVNVLGLNAAIEAASAGEYGKGFAVVADEIRKLAKNTAKATGEIIGLVDTIQGGIYQVEKVMGSGLEKVRESAGLTDKAVNALEDIRKLVQVNQKRMYKIASSIAEMRDFSHQVGEAMGNVSAVSEKNGLVVKEVNVSTQEMSSQL